LDSDRVIDELFKAVKRAEQTTTPEPAKMPDADQDGDQEGDREEEEKKAGKPDCSETKAESSTGQKAGAAAWSEPG
jgi:hypothetical protein